MSCHSPKIDFVGTLHGRSNLRDGNGRRVGSEDGLRLAERVQLFVRHLIQMQTAHIGAYIASAQHFPDIRQDVRHAGMGTAVGRFGQIVDQHLHFKLLNHGALPFSSRHSGAPRSGRARSRRRGDAHDDRSGRQGRIPIVPPPAPSPPRPRNPAPQHTT